MSKHDTSYIVADEPKATPPGIRTFATGANRNQDKSKHDFDGFLSPLFLEAFGTYMHFNRLLDDGSVRDSDNWQKGIPLDVYRKSGWRHWLDVVRVMQGYSIGENLIWAACGLVFNLQGIIVESIKKNPGLLDACLADMERKRNLRWDREKLAKEALTASAERTVPRFAVGMSDNPRGWEPLTRMGHGGDGE